MINEQEIVVQVRLDAHWQKATRYEGDDPTKAHALAKQLVSEAQCDEVRILHGHFDSSKQKLVYHQLFTSGQLVRSASLPEKQILPEPSQRADAHPPSSPQQERLDSGHHVPQSADDIRATVDQSQPKNPSSRPRSRKKMIGVGVAAGVVLSAILQVYDSKFGIFEDPKVTGYGVLTVEAGGMGVCVEGEDVKDILSTLSSSGKITEVQASTVRVTKGLEEVFVKLKTKGCTSFFGRAASIKLISDGLTRDHRKYYTGDWVSRRDVTEASINSDKKYPTKTNSNVADASNAEKLNNDKMNIDDLDELVRCSAVMGLASREMKNTDIGKSYEKTLSFFSEALAKYMAHSSDPKITDKMANVMYRTTDKYNSLDTEKKKVDYIIPMIKSCLDKPIKTAKKCILAVRCE